MKRNAGNAAYVAARSGMTLASTWSSQERADIAVLSMKTGLARRRPYPVTSLHA